MNALETPSQRPRLGFGLENIDPLFPGFATGDFGVLYGSPTCLTLSWLLCVRCQLPEEQGGLGSPVVLVDGGNTFDLYGVSRIAQQYAIDPKCILERIFISRAFTAYQLTSLIIDGLKPAVDKVKAKLIVISDIIGLYLDRDMPKTEAKDVFNKLTLFLSEFPKENGVTIVATHPTGKPSPRSLFMELALLGRAGVVIRVKGSHPALKFALEKHPLYKPGTAEFPSEGITLREFTEA